MRERIIDKDHRLEALKEMILERKPDAPVEQVLTIFCQRYGVSMAKCKTHYAELVAKGKIKEK